MYFTQYPEAEVSGERVRVAFKLRETHSAELHRITGTWVGVNEGGEWKLDRLEDEEIEYLY